MRKRLLFHCIALFFSSIVFAQKYPQGYFMHPLSIPMELVANFGEIRTNHWHMGLDIRTQQRENLRVLAAAEGYVARVVVEPGGFGQAIYIAHPNGLTTLYAHLNAFFPELQKHVLEQQYAKKSWRIDLRFLPSQFPVSKGEYIALSGNTGGSQGPHVHFEIRDSKTEKVLNPILFKFPIPDAVPPSLLRLAMYDRNKSTYAQVPQMLSIQNTKGRTIRVGSNKISFAIGAVDRFSRSANPNGIYSARVLMDAQPISEFILDNISYDETRFMNAQIDYPLSARGGSFVQHITPLPGATKVAYNVFNDDGIIYLNDNNPHKILIEVKDANLNTSRLEFNVQYDPSLSLTPSAVAPERLIPNVVNVIEKPNFEVFTSDITVYDTVNVVYSTTPASAPGSVSVQHNFLNATIPSHDFVTVRIKLNAELTPLQRERVILKNTSGTRTYYQKAQRQNDWYYAKFRQFGSYQAFVDTEPPTINNVSSDLTKAKRIVFSPRDNFNTIKSFRAELNGQWLRFTNDKGKTWIYTFDTKFPRGEHQLKVIVEDEAGNVTEKTWTVRR